MRSRNMNVPRRRASRVLKCFGADLIHPEMMDLSADYLAMCMVLRTTRATSVVKRKVFLVRFWNECSGGILRASRRTISSWRQGSHLYTIRENGGLKYRRFLATWHSA